MLSGGSGLQMKFGLKKKDKASGSVEKKAKRKASRGSGDGLAKMKAFFANHIEKLLLGAIAACALLLVYAGFRKETLDTDPEKVRAEVSRAQSNIQSSTWAEVKQVRQPETDRFDEQATQDTIGIDLSAYAMNVPFHPRLQQQNKRRSDPELLPPFDLEVNAGYGALAIKSNDRDTSISSMIEGGSSKLRSLPSGFNKGRGDTRLGGSYEGRFFVVITGLIPYKKQFDLYQEAFMGAAEYEMERDVPKYLGLSIERAEVKADGSLDQWQPLDTVDAMLKEPAKWDGREEERVDREYILPELNMPLPPFVLRDVSLWARHSTIPLLTNEEMTRGDSRRVEEENVETTGEGPRTFLDRGADSGADERRRSTKASELADESGDYHETAEPLLKVDNGMLRYFDFTAEPGKVYVYRVQAVLEDPNNPSEGNKPAAASCETEVVVRRQSATEPLRRTPWSEPTDSIVVPTGQRVLASMATAPGLMAAGPKGRVRIERKPADEPTINVMTLTWNNEGPYDVPFELQVGRGAVLNGAAAKTEVIDPTVAKVRPLEQYSFVTDAMVLDIDGGLPVGADLVSPGYVLVRMRDGRLQFRSEIGDVDDVQANTIPPEEDAEVRTEVRRNEEGEEVEKPAPEELRYTPEGPNEGPRRRGRVNNGSSNNGNNRRTNR
jgi:hypothetical protein